MSFCANCGKEIGNAGSCPNCGFNIIIDGEVINETSEVINENASSGRVSLNKTRNYNYGNNLENSSGSNGGEPLNKEKLSTVAKVLIAIATVFIPGIGPIFGIISGIILMADSRLSYKSFGKSMLTLGIVLMMISFLCCIFRTIIWGVIGFL